MLCGGLLHPNLLVVAEQFNNGVRAKRALSKALCFAAEGNKH